MKNLNLFQGQEHQSFFWNSGQPAALLVHGFPGTPAELRPLATSLHWAGWTVHGPLLPGFGANIDTLFERDHREWVSAVEQALANLQKKHSTVLLVGYSMGAALALQAAARQSPSGLVLIAPFWKLATAWQQAIGIVLKPFLRQIQPLKKVDFSDPQVQHSLSGFFPDVDMNVPEVQQELRNLRVPTSIFEQLHRVGQGGYQAAPKIDAPTLIVQGTEDEVSRRDRTRKLAGRFSAPLHYVEFSGGHDIIKPEQLTWPDVENSVLAFAQSVQRSTR